jgi:hypothetical protein
VDTTPPVLGFLFDSEKPYATFQSRQDEISAYWTGFSDLESGIEVSESPFMFKYSNGAL